MSRTRQAFFALVVVAGFFLGLEAALHLAHFHYSRNLSYMQFGYPNQVELHQVFELDPLLLFRMKPGYDFKLGFGPLNRSGFRGRDFEKAKPAGTIRIACLGDSVTFGTAEGAYPQMLEEILNSSGTGRFEVMDFGVPGYTSFQGKVLLKEVLADYHPDWVVVFYGWNDHWLAQGFPDADQKIKPETALTKVRNQLARLRTYQLLNKLTAKFTAHFGKKGQKIFRVPPDQYEQNLAGIIELCRASGAQAALTTAPAGFGITVLPDYLTYLGFAKKDENIEQLHASYNRIASRVAAEKNVPLVDLDLIFRERGVKNYFDRPDKDIIHPNRAGLELIAESASSVIIKSIEKAGN